LFFAPQIAWESQRDLSHTVLASSLAAATLYCLFHHSPAHAFSITSSSASVADLAFSPNTIFPVDPGALIAAGSYERVPSSALQPRISECLPVCALIVLPNVLWIVNHPDKAFHTITKLALNKEASWLTTTFSLPPQFCRDRRFHPRGADSPGLVRGSRPTHALPEPLPAHGHWLCEHFWPASPSFCVVHGRAPDRVPERWFQPVMVVIRCLRGGFSEL
jgi:hypothetical protein